MQNSVDQWTGEVVVMLYSQRSLVGSRLRADVMLSKEKLQNSPGVDLADMQ